MLFPAPNTHARAHTHTQFFREKSGVWVCLREPGIVVWETSTLSSRCEPLSFGVPQRELQAPWPKGGCGEDTAHPQQLWNRLINN